MLRMPTWELHCKITAFSDYSCSHLLDSPGSFQKTGSSTSTLNAVLPTANSLTVGELHFN
jgi:hypothetical protein